MKTVAILALLFVGKLAEATTLNLKNGDLVSIQPNTITTVTCTASGSGGGGGWDPSPGIGAAADFCATLKYDSDKSTCLEVVGASRCFSPEAVDVCAKINYDSDKLSCIRAIANKHIPEAKACGAMRYDSDKLSCLNKLNRSCP